MAKAISVGTLKWFQRKNAMEAIVAAYAEHLPLLTK